MDVFVQRRQEYRYPVKEIAKVSSLKLKVERRQIFMLMDRLYTAISVQKYVKLSSVEGYRLVFSRQYTGERFPMCHLFFPGRFCQQSLHCRTYKGAFISFLHPTLICDSTEYSPNA